ncbi:MAG TPA: peptide chain release factor 1 [Acetobacteraceae bacterium]|nr:peptide chain release factor 1 [Acetobacteraceae bacterium]
MSEAEMDAKLKELDQLLNDPEVKMDPHRVWSLLAEISRPPATQATASRPN